MGVINELIGKKFGKLTVLYDSGERSSRNIKWLCKCDCGNYKNIKGADLLSGNTNSCGCFKIENTKRVNSTHGQSRRNGQRTAEYRAYYALKNRCYNKKCKSYPDYGGRGIKVCDRWLNSFENFFEDMGKKPSANHSIDRINVNGNYEKYNCRWATRKQQANNVRNNILVTYKNKTQSLSVWCDELNLKYPRTKARLKLGWSIEDSFTLEKQKK